MNLKLILYKMKLKNVLSISAMLMVVFLSGCKKDDIGVIPAMSSSDPLNNVTGVARNKVIAFTFSESMDPATINNLTFTLKQGETLVPGTVTYSGKTATFTPTNTLAASTLYTATITTGAKSTIGNSLAENAVWSFTTGASMATTLTDKNPANNLTGVPRNKVIAFTFSETMDPLTINALTFTLKQGATAVAGTVTYSGTTASFTPTNVLAAGTVYTATVTTGAKSLTGNSLAVNAVWSFTTAGTVSALATVNLGTAGDYVILAKSAINNSAITAITGNLGLSPAATSYITGLSLTDATGYATSSQVTGKVYAADMAPISGINLTTSVENMITAYNDAAGRPSPDFNELYTGNLGGKTLVPGLYKWTNTVTLPSSVTISGSATDVWIFQIAGDLTVSSAIIVTLSGGALAKNIFWQVAGQATLGTTSQFKGIILSMTGITLQTGATVSGRLLAQTAVVLDASVVTEPQ
jgi:hypothetical protein